MQRFHLRLLFLFLCSSIPGIATDRVAVQEISRLLVKARSQEELGQHDASIATYREVLRIEPYNIAARRGMEVAELEKATYLEATRDQAHSRSLNDVGKQWGQDISSFFGARNTSAIESPCPVGEAKKPARLLDFTLPQLALNGVTVEEAIEFLRVKSRDADTLGRGLNLLLVPSTQSERRTYTLTLSNITFRGALDSLADVSGLKWHQEESAIMFGTLENNLLCSRTFKVPPDFFETSELTLAKPVSETGGFGVVKTSTPDLLRGMGVEMPESATAHYSRSTNQLVVRTTAPGLELLELLLEDRQAKASRQFMVEVKMIDITNEALEQMDRKAGGGPSLLSKAKSLLGLGSQSEYTRDADRRGGSSENGLDWVNGMQTAGMVASLLGVNQMTLGAYGISLGSGGPPGGAPSGGMPGGGATAGGASGEIGIQGGSLGGGAQSSSTGQGASPTGSAPPPGSTASMGKGGTETTAPSQPRRRVMQMPSSQGVPSLPKQASGGRRASASSMPGGVQMGSAMGADGGIPDIGGGGSPPGGSVPPSGAGSPSSQGTLSSGLTSGSFSLAGLLSNPMLSQMMKAVRQKTGTDIMAVPSVLATSGHRSSIKIVREFPYPTEFEPPQIPQSVGQFTVGNTTTLTGNNRGPVTPTTPTAFEKRDVGFTLQVEGIVSEDRKSIELSVQPEFTEFEGFIDYGQPIYEVGAGGSRTTLTDNKIQQAIFRTTKTNNINVRIYSGATIVLAGLLDERRTVRRSNGDPSGGLVELAGSGTQALPKKRAIILTVTATVQKL